MAGPTPDGLGAGESGGARRLPPPSKKPPAEIGSTTRPAGNTVRRNEPAAIPQSAAKPADHHFLTFPMRVLLNDMIKEPDKARIQMRVQFGDEPPKLFLGDYDGSDEKYKFCNVEQELFMRLSELAAKKYCNCAIYQMELMGIIGAFISGQTIPKFPIELGTTNFGISRPSGTKIFFDRMRRPFYRAWSWWKLRHIRRKNLKEYKPRSKSNA